MVLLMHIYSAWVHAIKYIKNMLYEYKSTNRERRSELVHTDSNNK